jgi:hypothetical protein
VKCAFLLLAVGCLLPAVMAQSWTGPYQLSSSTSDDVNPSACKEFLTSDRTCLVWQRLTAESWNIFSRFGSLYNGNDWSPEMALTRDSVYGNVNPAVACLKDSSYWCVWEHRLSPLVGSIRASFVTIGDSWSTPVELGPVIHTDGDSAVPSIITINGESADTVWVAWRNHDTSGAYIRYACHVADSWSSSEIAVAADLRHAKLGRAEVRWVAKPMLVWEQAERIWYSIRDSSGWAAPAEVAPSDSEDHDPDVVSSGGLMSWGAYVVWQSMRDGDTAIYIAGTDSLSTGQRVSGGYGNFNPVGANIAFTTLENWGCVVAWVTDRNGNPDIYTNEYNSSDARVDTNSADDLSPVVTSMGNGRGAQMAWVLWQSNRNGNWDIFGSFQYNSGIEENPRSRAPNHKPAATIIRSLPAGAVAFDAMGRRVLDPKPGVYFVRDEGRGARDVGRVRKVVIQR